MGSVDFWCRTSGKTAQEAFSEAVKEAQHWHGHNGYTGTIAEKSSFVMFPPMTLQEIKDNSETLLDDPRVNGKYDPAGCIQIAEKDFLFFGWASW